MEHLTAEEHSEVALLKPLLLPALLLMLLLLLFALPSRALADQADISINVIPSSLSFPPPANTPEHVDIEVSNLTTDTLQKLQLCMFTSANVGIENMQNGVPAAQSLAAEYCLASPDPLGPGSQYVWPIDLARTGDLAQSDTVQLRVNYERPVTGQNELVQRSAFSTLTVQSLQPPAVQQVAEASLVGSLDTLNDQQQSRVFLLITNKSNFELQITNLVPKGPTFITMTPENYQKRIPPGQATTIAIDVMANGPVIPGKQSLVFEIGISWMANGQAQSGNLVVNQQVDVGVLGVTEFLPLLGIPSLLILPGFLILVVVQQFMKLVKPPYADQIQLKVASPEYWVAAITLSIITDLIYYWRTGHKFWVSYDLSDIAKIWISSIVAALLLYPIVVALINFGIQLYTNYKIWKMQQYTPAETDSATTILRKLHNQNLDLVRKYVKLKVGGEERRVFLLEQEEPSKTEYWVSPPIVVRWKDGQGQALQDEFNGCLKNKSASSLADFLDNPAHKTAWWYVGWRKLRKYNSEDLLIGGPHKAQQADLDLDSSQQFIVEQEFFTEYEAE